MFPSFTGNSRPRRQVNLSGRNSNPFTAHATSRVTSTPPTSQSALVQAQQERAARQLERERPPAAVKIQRSWRGHRGRKITRSRWRHEWDLEERWGQENLARGSYASEKQCLKQLQLLVQFTDTRSEDLLRLQHFAKRLLDTGFSVFVSASDHTWRFSLLRLAKTTIKALDPRSRNHPKRNPLPEYFDQVVPDLLTLLQYLTEIIPELLAEHAEEYYRVLAFLTIGPCHEFPERLTGPIFALLQANHMSPLRTYIGFVKEFLTVPDLPDVFPGLDGFEGAVQYQALAEGLAQNLSSGSQSLLQSKSHEQIFWLLAYFIHFHRFTGQRNGAPSTAPDARYVKIVSVLVSFLAEDIAGRLDTPQFSVSAGRDDSHVKSFTSMPKFVQSEISSLVSQENVSGLLASLEIRPHVDGRNLPSSEEATLLASYALMLLRVFPRRGDEIRMWLYRGSTAADSTLNGERLPAVKYFYQAARSTQVFRDIRRDPKATVRLLRSENKDTTFADSGFTGFMGNRDQQWRIILLFLELYTFPLKIMDDEEFLSSPSTSVNPSLWTRKSALPLDQIRELTHFLKNLAFSLYWYASEIEAIETLDTHTSLADYFGHGESARVNGETKPKTKDHTVAGVSGLSFDYVKGMVTGVLRMLYERDSRRKFLPKDHWLMTQYFEMDRFISAVVKEEEEKHKIERSYEDEYGAGTVGTDQDEQNEGDERFLVGTSHTQQVRHAERLRRQQQKASRRKYLESVTPRLEILQNMPFFIPFETRVEIFREFVIMDQVGRRGTADPDEWRFGQINSPTGTISRHRAKVRRKNIFEDAFDQFYELGDGLKEPIQIRFVDEFDTVEEGIDGGGVTKEFLTSITNEAFGAADGLESLFIENDEHLLYPNPSAIEERKESLRRALYREGSPGWNENVRDLLRRYEFLGRIIGKCLYEGILVDIHFAPFFLLKWALTGGFGSASKESGYRANLNDLRDLDKGLYQGLLQLKDYPGNVEDFSLDFTVADDLRISPMEVKTVTRDLVPGGGSVSVNNENRLVYISYMARYRLQIQPQLQTSAFLRGLGTIVSPSWLSMFNQSELQTLVSGTSTDVNIPDLRANTQYGGVYALGDDGREHPSIQIFWKVMQDLSDADKKKVLKFVTSTPRAPLLGFKNLNPRFSIRDSGSDQTRLPSTSTCVNLLKLPIYRDENTLRERLLYSVNSGAGFNLS